MVESENPSLQTPGTPVCRAHLWEQQSKGLLVLQPPGSSGENETGTRTQEQNRPDAPQKQGGKNHPKQGAEVTTQEGA